MPENFLFNLIYSLVFGLTEFLCVDASAHGSLYEMMYGREQTDPMLTLFLRIGALTALICSCWPKIRRLTRERRLSLRSRRHNRQNDPVAQLDLRLLKTAVIPALISVLFYRRAGELITGLLPLALMLTLNGVLLFIPRLLNQGNKDGRSASRLDAVLIGLGGALGAVPGFSRMGGMLSAGSFRGFDRIYALDTALLISVPVFVGLLVFDITAVIAAKIAVGFIALVLYLLYAAIAFGGAWAMIMFMRYLSAKTGFTGFAYYSWGFALFAFILYLMI